MSVKTKTNNFQQVLNTFSIHTNDDGSIKDNSELKQALELQKKVIQNSLYFSAVVDEPFDAQVVIDYYLSDVLPELNRQNLIE